MTTHAKIPTTKKLITFFEIIKRLAYFKLLMQMQMFKSKSKYLFNVNNDFNNEFSQFILIRTFYSL